MSFIVILATPLTTINIAPTHNSALKTEADHYFLLEDGSGGVILLE